MCAQSTPAAAGDPETFLQILVHPTDPDSLVVRYGEGTTGLFFSSDRGKSWKVICSAMFGPDVRGDAAMTLTASGNLLTGGFAGLWQGTPGGCKWSQAAELGTILVSDIIIDPTDPKAAFAVTGSGDPSQPNGLFRQDASGQWREVGARHEAAISRSRVVARDAGTRIYESALLPQPATASPDAPRQYMIRVSDDVGQTWREHPHPIPRGPTLRLEAVDPTNPDNIVLTLDALSGMDTVLVSEDQGATMREFIQVSQISGIAFAPDGRLWIGDRGSAQNLMAPRGLWAATSIKSTPKLLNEDRVNCVTYAPLTDTLYVCRRCDMGTVEPSSGAFKEIVSFWNAREIRQLRGN